MGERRRRQRGRPWLLGWVLVLAAGCSCAPEVPVWSCPPRTGEGGEWPRWYTAIYGEAGAAPAGAAIAARLGGNVIGRALAHGDGSFLLRLRLDSNDGDADLPGARVDLRFRDSGGRFLGNGWVRIPRAAPVVFYNHGESCAEGVWDLQVRFQEMGSDVPEVVEMLAVDMLGPARTPVDPVPLGEQVRRELPLESCSAPWLLFARHAAGQDEPARVSGCWDTCPQPGPRCGGCTRAAWAAGLCDFPGPADGGPADGGPRPDGGPGDAGPGADAGPITPPD